MYRLDELPTRLREIRRGQGKRQEDVADSLNISRELLSRYENKKLNLYLDRAEALAANLGYRVLFDLEPLNTAEEDGANA